MILRALCLLIIAVTGFGEDIVVEFDPDLNYHKAVKEVVVYLPPIRESYNAVEEIYPQEDHQFDKKAHLDEFVKDEPEVK